MSRHTTSAQLGASASHVQAALQRATSDRVVSRLWARDHTLWKSDPTEISNRLGWLTLVEHPAIDLAELTEFANSVRRDGYRDIVLLGMGGSSLGPEVLRLTFGSAKGYPRLWVLDTTVPSAVRAVTKAISPKTTLFLVASKSGGTIEVMSLFAHFEALVRSAPANRGGHQFVAITDPGTSLVELAQRKGFRHTFLNPPDIGGRYSVLSYFGLVPAALIGVDVQKLMARATAMATACRHDSLVENPGAYLGIVLGALARQGRDKVTLMTSPGISSYGIWTEQLLAESTGKEGTGLVPVADEPAGPVAVYGKDRVFVYLRLKGDRNGALDKRPKQLAKAGHPVLELSLTDRYDLGAEFFRWEFATAVAGYVLGIHPFDQPNVQESKDNTGRILREAQASGHLPPVQAVDARKAVTDLLAQCGTGSYVGILAYLQPTRQADRAIRLIRRRLMSEGRVATTAGYGPRYLHSTGQVHKGGPPCGLFLQLLEAPKPDVPIPGQSYTFGTLAEAQAIGDLQSLHAHGRPALQLRLSANPLAALTHLGGGPVRSGKQPRKPGTRARRKFAPRRRRPK